MNLTEVHVITGMICALHTVAMAASGLVTVEPGARGYNLSTRSHQGSEAQIWFLGHAGWAVRTTNHLLIFDYWEEQAPPALPSLSNGFIDADEIRNTSVVVFVTHSHGDHFDPVIFEWESQLPDVTYVFGWDASDNPNHLCLTEERDVQTIDDIRISTINHSFDNIPEVAFLVEVDGLTIFHSGDHGSVGDQLNPVFQNNIDYLADRIETVDIAFLSIFGRRGGGVVNLGDRYTVERLRPKVTLPMHREADAQAYADWIEAMQQWETGTNLAYATNRGDRFRYHDGQIELAGGGNGV